MRIHLLGLPHTQTSKRWNGCAFSIKVLRLSQMLSGLGHDVVHYGNEGSDPVCSENVVLMSETERERWYPFAPEKHVRFDTGDDFHRRWYARAIEEVRKRLTGRDILACPWGHGHKPVADAVHEALAVETGVGYETTFSRFRVFESANHQSWVYGRSGQQDGHLFDAVIPNAFDPQDFTYQERKGDYHLYLGRIIQRKGVHIAVEATRRAGVKLLVAGPGDPVTPEGLDLRAHHVEFVGFADIEKRRALLAGAQALWVPTLYSGPFEGVSIEAAFSGTPTITTDHGVFPETILHGVTGWRCRALEQFVWAAKSIDRIKSADCLAWAQNFALDRVAPMYGEYLGMLSTLWGDGWYAERPGRAGLDWLRRSYPSGA
jgi:glycosyltransferase involved in cell wall biosynthesis